MPTFALLGSPVIAGNMLAAPVDGAPDPDVIAPDVIAPDVIAPDVIAPDVIAPDVIAPDVIAPDGIAPDGIAPDVIAPAEDMELVIALALEEPEPAGATALPDELDGEAVELEPQAPSTRVAAATPAIMVS